MGFVVIALSVVFVLLLCLVSIFGIKAVRSPKQTRQQTPAATTPPPTKTPAPAPSALVPVSRQRRSVIPVVQAKATGQLDERDEIISSLRELRQRAIDLLA